MRITVLLAALVAGIGLAGAQDTPATGDAPVQNRGDGPFPVELPNPSPGRPNVPITRACADIEADARALVDAARVCDVNTENGCEVVSLEELVQPDSCIAAFQCSAPLSPEIDRRAFVARAVQLEAEKLACGECAMAACQPPAELEAVCVEGLCELAPQGTQQPSRPVPPAR
ncbi:MAG: hypothetical protein ACK4YP_02730 [Myxococcota bacterium]